MNMNNYSKRTFESREERERERDKYSEQEDER